MADYQSPKRVYYYEPLCEFICLDKVRGALSRREAGSIPTSAGGSTPLRAWWQRTLLCSISLVVKRDLAKV